MYTNDCALNLSLLNNSVNCIRTTEGFDVNFCNECNIRLKDEYIKSKIEI